MGIFVKSTILFYKCCCILQPSCKSLHLVLGIFIPKLYVIFPSLCVHIIARTQCAHTHAHTHRHIPHLGAFLFNLISSVNLHLAYYRIDT